VDADSIDADAVDVFTYTIKDGDGDLTTATLTIDVADVTLAPDNDTILVDEAALPFGSDPDSTDETAGGTLNVTGAVSYAFASGSDGNGTYGTLTLNSNGTYSYTLASAMDSGAIAGANTVNGVEVFNYTATDANGNTVDGTITVDIVDDVPSFIFSQDAYVSNVIPNTVTGMFDFSLGADGGSIAVTLTSELVTTNGEAIVLTQVDADTWLGETSGGTDVFQLDIDLDTQEYTFTLLGPDLIAASEEVNAGNGQSFGAGPNSFYIIPDATNPNADLVLLTGFIASGNFNETDFLTDNFASTVADIVADEVNLSTNGYGVSNQNLNDGELLLLDFTDDSHNTTDGSGQTFSGPSVTGVNMSVSKGGETVIWVAYDSAGNVVGSNTETTAAFTVTGDNGELIDYVLIYGSDVNAKVNVVSVTTLTNTGQADVEFEVVGTDSDGDVSAPATITVQVDGSGELTGTAANEVFSGGGGENNILTGGGGEDIFMFTAEDQGTVGTPDNDIITDFGDAGADVLDISDLLVGEESGTLTDYLTVNESGSDVVIEVNPDGASGVTEVITLQNTTLADLGANAADSQADIINSLVTNGHINVDQS
jgi:VCBS repeat-containing protein